MEFTKLDLSIPTVGAGRGIKELPAQPSTPTKASLATIASHMAFSSARLKVSFKEFRNLLSGLMVILVTGKTREKHLENLKEVLIRLDKVGIRPKLKKCVFLQNQLIYLGHRINSDGNYTNHRRQSESHPRGTSTE